MYDEPPIEQALFSSAATVHQAGYHVVARTAGVAPEDERALAQVCPSHDGLCERLAGANSLNYCALPSGRACVSYSFLAGPEYSGRTGAAVCTHSLLVPAATLARFANNPLAVWAAYTATCAGKLHDVPRTLEPVVLCGRTALVDGADVARVARSPGVSWLLALLAALSHDRPLVVVHAPHPRRLVAGLLNCLPLGCRAQTTFSTGWRYSPRRDLRLVLLPELPTEQRRLFRDQGVQIADLAAEPPAELSRDDAYARWLRPLVEDGRWADLARGLAQFAPAQLAELHELARVLEQTVA